MFRPIPVARHVAQAELQAVRDSLIETERSHVRDQQVLAEAVSHERRQCEEAEVGHAKERMAKSVVPLTFPAYVHVCMAAWGAVIQKALQVLHVLV